jgi:hypothetical protein
VSAAAGYYTPGGEYRSRVTRTVCKPNRRLAHTSAPNRRRVVVHVASNVQAVWKGGRLIGHEVWYDCGTKPPLTGSPATLVNEVPSDPRFVRCKRCDVDDIQVAPVVAYLADTGSAYKIGYTSRLVGRMIDLDAELIRQAPGGAELERQLLDAMPDQFRQSGREFFHRTPGALKWAHAAFDALTEPDEVAA